jgi:hypothetical protein
METIRYQGWRCARLRNKLVEVVLTLDVGPRVIRFGFLDGENEFKEYAEQLGRKGGRVWRIYGGHRLWHAPEGSPRSYWPDNFPIEAAAERGGVRLTQRVEKSTGIQKEMVVRLDPDQAQVTVTHRLRNRGPWPIELAPWALTVMAQGGCCILPHPPRGQHPRDLLPVNSLTLWAYTDMSDPRWTWGEKFILLRQESDPARAKPQKIGAWVPDGWVAYANGGRLLVKKFTPQPAARYPDGGCCVEAFTDKDMLEMETLGPLTSLAPGAAVEHVEQWFLFRGVLPPRSDADVARRVLPKVRTVRP